MFIICINKYYNTLSVYFREQWKGFEGSYHPVFSDGWAPENPFSEERERAEATAAAAAALAQKRRNLEVVSITFLL